MSLIIFDCDGVLVESEAIIVTAELDLLDAAGLKLERTAYMRKFMGTPYETWKERVSAAILAATGTGPAPGLFERMLSVVEERLRSELVAVDGARVAIEAIDAKVCVASSSSPTALEWKLHHTGLMDLFDPHFFSSALVANGKPAPDLFLLAAQRMSAEPSECIVVEDSSNGVIAANRAGMKAVGFVGGGHCTPEHGQALLDDGADLLVSSYAGLKTALATLGSSDNA